MRLPLGLVWRGAAQPQPTIQSHPSSVVAAVAKNKKIQHKTTQNKNTKGQTNKQKEEELKKQSICLNEGTRPGHLLKLSASENLEGARASSASASALSRRGMRLYALAAVRPWLPGLPRGGASWTLPPKKSEKAESGKASTTRCAGSDAPARWSCCIPKAARRQTCQK